MWYTFTFVSSPCYDMGKMYIFTDDVKKYCKFGNFRENFIFANRVISHICDITNSRLGHDLPISVNDRLISPFCEVILSQN